MKYRLLIDLEVVEALQRFPRRAREEFLDHFDKIRDFPSKYSDYHEYDAVGRRIEISICRRFAIHYWIDVPDRHIKVLALHPVGGGSLPA